MYGASWTFVGQGRDPEAERDRPFVDLSRGGETRELWRRGGGRGGGLRHRKVEKWQTVTRIVMQRLRGDLKGPLSMDGGGGRRVAARRMTALEDTI